MTYFTVAYLVRLVTWGLTIALLQGPLVLLSWLAWEHVVAKAAAVQRHRLLCAHFAALALLPTLTLAVLHWNVAAMGAAGVHGSSSPEPSQMMAGYQGALRLSGSLALLWFAGTVTMALRLTSEVRQIGKLRHQPAPTTLVGTVRCLSRGWKGVSVPEVWSANILTPQVVGLRRPVLLVPRNFAQRLPMTERDAVLLHELAHVRRRDFGWNLVQRCVLAALWFQPAAWLLYRRLSSEREKCCDDLAVRRGARATDLARALVRLAENRTASAIGMAAARRTDLTPRIHYLLGLCNHSRSSSRQRGIALTASAMCVLTLSAGRLTHVDPAMGGLCNASAFGWTVSIDAHDSSGSFALRIRRGRVIEASVEERLLPSKDIHQDGDHVTLMGATRQPIVALTVAPQGRIWWEARRPELTLR